VKAKKNPSGGRGLEEGREKGKLGAEQDRSTEATPGLQREPDAIEQFGRRGLLDRFAAMSDFWFIFGPTRFCGRSAAPAFYVECLASLRLG